jgi:hypothetical protein
MNRNFNPPILKSGNLPPLFYKSLDFSPSPYNSLDVAMSFTQLKNHLHKIYAMQGSSFECLPSLDTIFTGIQYAAAATTIPTIKGIACSTKERQFECPQIFRNSPSRTTLQ